jgi:hypothetical protein
MNSSSSSSTVDHDHIDKTPPDPTQKTSNTLKTNRCFNYSRFNVPDYKPQAGPMYITKCFVLKDQLLHRTSPSVFWRVEDSLQSSTTIVQLSTTCRQETVFQSNEQLSDQVQMHGNAEDLCHLPSPSISPTVRNTSRVQYRRIRDSARRGTEIGTGASSL